VITALTLALAVCVSVADQVATIEDFEAAARAATPEGCNFLRVDFTATPGAMAVYDCD